jgi:hypothetical protein
MGLIHHIKSQTSLKQERMALRRSYEPIKALENKVFQSHSLERAWLGTIGSSYETSFVSSSSCIKAAICSMYGIRVFQLIRTRSAIRLRTLAIARDYAEIGSFGCLGEVRKRSQAPWPCHAAISCSETRYLLSVERETLLSSRPRSNSVEMMPLRIFSNGSLASQATIPSFSVHFEPMAVRTMCLESQR